MELERQLRKDAAKEREVSRPKTRALRERAPKSSAAPLSFEPDRAPPWRLLDAELRPGAVIEVYTNHHHGWLRGRFEWTPGEAHPWLAINIWDPEGPADEDGLPPWVGEMRCEIPAKALCRWGR